MPTVTNVGFVDKTKAFVHEYANAVVLSLAFAVVIARGMPQRDWPTFVLIAALGTVVSKGWAMRNESNPLSLAGHLARVLHFLIWFGLVMSTKEVIHWWFYFGSLGIMLLIEHVILPRFKK